ncbi:MAG TPA: FAD-binding oxidoreductase [Bryobacteraceae bacterium]|nr:FAD-binding oxidoreductase [Bryobacteraceae bacterium]
MSVCTPTSPEELADLLREAASQSKTVNLTGNGSKRRMGGPEQPADVRVSTRGLDRLLQYEPGDLTVSVHAGMLFRDLQRLLGERGQMIALDPPFAQEATVGGIVACNSSGPMRRGYGTARDLIIGMSFTTVEGKLVQTGGMVVKNVAGLDMGKLMIGSFGTLAAITSINFRVHSRPEQTRTFVFSFDSLDAAIEKRDAILSSVLQPMAIDLISSGEYLLAVRAGGSQRVLDRYARELAGSGMLTGEDENGFWEGIREFTPNFLSRELEGIVVRVSTPLSEIGKVIAVAPDACICRAGSGVTYVYGSYWEQLSPLWNAIAERRWSAAVEFAPKGKDLWFSPESGPKEEAFAMMKRVKQMFDPGSLLNRSRLYGRI